MGWNSISLQECGLRELQHGTDIMLQAATFGVEMQIGMAGFGAGLTWAGIVVKWQ